jgi:hypothetical protein
MPTMPWRIAPDCTRNPRLLAARIVHRAHPILARLGRRRLSHSPNVRATLTSAVFIDQKTAISAILRQNSVRQRGCVDLSDGRHAELEVTFAGPWPTRATYVDPREDSVTDLKEAVERLEPTDAAVVSDTSRKPSRWSGVFGLRPAPAGIVFGVILVWLLFWTPGTNVSAAERIAGAIKWLVSRVLEPRAVPAAPPAANPPSSSVVPAAVMPSPNAGLTVAPRPSRLTAARRTALELRAIAQLQRVDAYLGQEVSFASLDSTRVDVRAAVDGDARKQVLLGALAPLARSGEVHAEIADLRSAASRVTTQAIDTDKAVRDFAFVKDQFPMFETLRRYFRHQHEFQSQTAVPSAVDEASIDTETRRFAIRVLDHSRRASQHAWALKHLGDRFPASLIRSAPSETQELWQTVSREHARAYRQEMALLRAALEPVMRTSGLLEGSPEAMPTTVLNQPSDVWSRIDRLLDLHRVEDRAIQAAFAIQSDDRAGVNLVQTTAFWRLLEASETLASEIVGVRPPVQ